MSRGIRSLRTVQCRQRRRCRLKMHHGRNGFLTAKGLEEAAQRSLEGLEVCDVVAEPASSSYLDRVGSVSGLVEVEEFHVWDYELIQDQYRRFLSG